jgi:ABC-type transport system involved in multi-copper enzyme maturation permease subunit
MALVINMVCSLLALLLIFDAICGERERGTLKVLLAGPVARDIIIVSKLVAGLITLLVPLLLSWVISLVYVLVVQRVQLTADQLGRFGWIVGLSAIYIAFFFSLGMAVSCWVQRSATALAVCLFCWVVFVLAVPNLVPMALRHFAPVPPQTKILLEKEAASRAAWGHANEWYVELMEAGEYDDVETVWEVIGKRAREQTNKGIEKIDRFNSSMVQRQLALNQQISRVSPSASYVYAATQLAGTGIRDYLRHLADGDAYKRAYQEVQSQQEEARLEQLKHKTRTEQPEFDAYDPSLWPKFEPTQYSLANALNQCWVDIVMLAGGTILLFLLSFIGFIRYDAR